MRTVRLLVPILLPGLPAVASAQDTLRVVRSQSNVVPASRVEGSIKETAVPVTDVRAPEMCRRGAVRLTDVIATVTGMTLFDDHGTAIRVQRFASDDTVVVLDGEPVIGRTARTLDIERLGLHGLDRCPTSSVFGSDRLAGVVNLVTAISPDGRSGRTSLRGGSFGRTDAEAGSDRQGGRLLLNRHSSAKYDLTPDAFGPSTPSWTDWTLDVRGRLEAPESVFFRLGARASVDNQEVAFALEGDVRFGDKEKRRDIMLHAEAAVCLSSRFRFRGRLYAARHATETRAAAKPTAETLTGTTSTSPSTRPSPHSMLVSTSGTSWPSALLRLAKPAAAATPTKANPLLPTCGTLCPIPLDICTGSDNGWYNANSSTSLNAPISGRTIVLRTATGYFAKIRILSYTSYNSNPLHESAECRYFTFDYVLEPDGSRNFRSTTAPWV